MSYANSGVKANVYFEVYDEIPVEQDEYTYTKKTNVTPLFAAYTADNSVYKGTIDLPAYLQKYISILRHSLRKPLLKQM